MRFSIVISLISILLASCMQQTNRQTTKVSTPALDNAQPTSIPEAATRKCFIQVLQRDTFIATFSHSGSNVTGKLIFDNFEKDGSTGTVQGTVQNNVFKGWYSFQSEGMESVMEVFFKEENDKLIRGIGEMSTKGDSSYFVNPATVKFEKGMTLEKINCDKIPVKYQ